MIEKMDRQKRQEYSDFFWELIRGIYESENDIKKINIILRKNSNKINNNLIDTLKEDVSYILISEEIKDKTKTIFFSLLFVLASHFQYTYTNEYEYNLEIAIQIWLICINFWTKTDFPEQWSAIQSALATAYAQRIFGDRVDNTKKAIFHLQNCLPFFLCALASLREIFTTIIAIYSQNCDRIPFPISRYNH